MGEFRPNNRGGFRGGDRGGRGGGFGGARGGGFRGGDRGPVVMNKAICDQCHKPCEVPFRPTAGKPVYCNACFGGKKEMGGGDRNNSYKTPPRTDFGNDVKKVSGEEIKKQIEVLNVKIDRLAGMIEKMNAGNKVVAEETLVVKEVKEKKAAKKVSKKK